MIAFALCPWLGFELVFGLLELSDSLNLNLVGIWLTGTPRPSDESWIASRSILLRSEDAIYETSKLLFLGLNRRSLTC